LITKSLFEADRNPRLDSRAAHGVTKDDK